MSRKKIPIHKQKARHYRFPECPVGLAPCTRKRLVAYMLHFMQGGKCFYCGRITKFASKNNHQICGLHATIDHIVPVSKGGTSDLENVVLSCADCNFRRGGRWINPHTREGISLPLDYKNRWNFLKQGGENALGYAKAKVLGY